MATREIGRLGLLGGLKGLYLQKMAKCAIMEAYSFIARRLKIQDLVCELLKR